MARQPNIVFFMTDQLRRDALGCYADALYKTPNLDRLAATGVCFENAFTDEIFRVPLLTTGPAPGLNRTASRSSCAHWI